MAVRGGSGMARSGPRRLTRRALKTATLPEILEWLGRQRLEDGMSRKEALAVLMWERALRGETPAIRLVFDFMASKPPQRISSEVAVQPMLPFTADEAAAAARALETADDGVTR